MPSIFLGFMVDLSDEQRRELDELLGFELPAPTPPPPEEPPDVPRPSPVSIGTSFDRAPGFAQELIRQTWPPEAWEHAAAIGECESNWGPRRHNTTGEDSRGLWQINIGPGANTDLAHLDLFDPLQNAEAARIVWKRQGWTAWRNCARLKGVPLSGPGVP